MYVGGVNCAVLLWDPDNLVLLFYCNVYIILINFCNGGSAGCIWNY